MSDLAQMLVTVGASVGAFVVYVVVDWALFNRRMQAYLDDFNDFVGGLR